MAAAELLQVRERSPSHCLPASIGDQLAAAMCKHNKREGTIFHACYNDFGCDQDFGLSALMLGSPAVWSSLLHDCADVFHALCGGCWPIAPRLYEGGGLWGR